MSVVLKELFQESFPNEFSWMEEIQVTRVRFYKASNKMELFIQTNTPLLYEQYQDLINRMKEMCGCKTVLFVDAKKQELSQDELYKYLQTFYRLKGGCDSLISASTLYEQVANRLTFQFLSEKDLEIGSRLLGDVTSYLNTIGLNGIAVDGKLLEVVPMREMPMETVPYVEPAKPVVEAPVKKANNYPKRSAKTYTEIALKDVENPEDRIQFDGEIFKVEEIEIKKRDMIIQTLSIFDGTSAINVKRFEGRNFSREVLREAKVGDYVRVFGSISYDKYANDNVCIADSMETLEKPKIVDDASTKRIELHMHTKMSEMNGVCSGAECVKYAYELGHDGICITDNVDVQSLVKAFNTASSLKKKNPDRPFKVGLGCEMQMVNYHLNPVRNGLDVALDDATYVCFDLETTGLSCHFDHIIEFGAVKMERGMQVGQMQMFIKPPVQIPPFITRTTNITNNDVANAKTFEQAIDEILAFIGNDVLVAHNATFDYHFINAELKRIGRKPINNCVIDTLDLAKGILKDRKYYRLGMLSRNYNVIYDENDAHRADYDAIALAGVFRCLMNDAKAMGAKTINDLARVCMGDDAYKKDRPSDVVVLAKNGEGLKSLYRLITESMTKTLATSSKTVAKPYILRESIMKKRENLLLGSSSLRNEVFELAANGDDQRLEDAISFYDFIEIQPLGNYSTLLARNTIPNKERLKEILWRIIKAAKKVGVLVVADSDAYYLKPSQKCFRDVYIVSQGVGGVVHPLYIRDESLRLRTPNPDQHMRLTKEMKDEFAWLDDPNLIEEIVITNTHKVFDQLEEVRPVPSGTFPPKMENSDQKLKDLCYQTAKEMYEFEGKIPHQVKERLDRELDSIITAGYYVNYYISSLLVRKSNADGYLVGSRGSVGSSFAATMSGITEVNPLVPHYRCPACHFSEWFEDGSVQSGFDLPDLNCPHCGTKMIGDGHNIPFETFLGFNGDKVPDIDLNFSSEYQAKAHAFCKEVFGEDHALRAGTIGGVAEKTSFGYVQGYCEKMQIKHMPQAMKEYLATGCKDVKRTTGQHPGGIIIVPADLDAEDFTPVQYPANDPESEWKTTHYDFHDIHDNVLKFDILGHVDPTAMRLLQNCSTTKPTDVPTNDAEVLSIFSSDEALHADRSIYKKETGALGLPEFGTRTTRAVLEETRPKTFAELTILSGLTHGTDVWAGNAQTLIQQGHTIDEVIGCRDDIMTYLLAKKLEPYDAFHIMEDVRKGRGLTEEQEKKMREHDVPDWYIDSCKKIKYMFPKAHAVAYVLMALRIAWYKVHEPWNFYIQFLTLRSNAYELETMMGGIEIVRQRMEDIDRRLRERDRNNPVSNKEKSLYDVLEVCEELYARGYTISNIDLYKSKATQFSVYGDDVKTIIPPFTVIDGLGDAVAKSIVEAREKGDFLSKEDLVDRTQLSSAMMRKLDAMGILEGMSELNQLSLF